MAYASLLEHMLSNVKPEQLLLVGDIVDLWAMDRKKRFKFPHHHKMVLASMFQQAMDGAQVTYIPGNHEGTHVRGRLIQKHDPETGKITEAWHRRGTGRNLFGISIKEATTLELPNGKKGLVMHGDEFDSNTIKSLYGIGDAAYTALGYVDSKLHHYLNNQHLSRVPELAKKWKHFSFANAAKYLVKDFITKRMGFLDRLERSLSESKDYDFILFGHTHMGGTTPVQTSMGTKYIINDGCCTEGVQFVAFDKYGRPVNGQWRDDAITLTDAKGFTKTIDFAEHGITLRSDVSSVPLDTEAADHQRGHVSDAAWGRMQKLLRVIYRLVPGRNQSKLIKQFHDAEHILARVARAEDPSQRTLTEAQQSSLTTRVEKLRQQLAAGNKIPGRPTDPATKVPLGSFKRGEDITAPGLHVTG